MSVILVCPVCGSAHTLLRLPVAELCPDCDSAYPPAARELAIQSLLTDVTPRPVLIVIGAGFSALWALCAAIFVLFAVVSSGPFTLNGEQVTKEVFVRSFLLPWWLPLLAYFGGTAWAVWTERSWTRELMLLFWIVALGVSAFAGDGGLAERAFNTVSCALCLGGAVWYLYGKPNVAAYYARLERKEGGTGLP